CRRLVASSGAPDRRPDPARDRARLQHHAAGRRFRSEEAVDLLASRLRGHAAGDRSADRRSRGARRIAALAQLCPCKGHARQGEAVPSGPEDQRRQAMDGLPTVAAGFPAGDRPRPWSGECSLRLRSWSSRPDPSGGDGTLDPRPSSGAGSGNRPFTFQSATLLGQGSGPKMARHSFFCIDGHTCGNPVRLVAGGGPRLEGATMMERRAHFLREFDWVRTGLMFEPRGHDMMSGSILYPPTREDCDVAILFIETSGCLPMCGHGTIGTVTFALEHGLVQATTPGTLRLDTPAGLVVAQYRQEGAHVEEVRITNVPAFLHSEGLEVECPDLGPLKVDVAYGGNFY